jgi:hypothetical protein
MDALRMFLELSKLESKKVRLQVLRLVDALESEALDAFRLARRLERKLWNDPAKLKSHGRAEIATWGPRSASCATASVAGNRSPTRSG